MNPWEELLAHATRARVKDEHDLMEMIAGNKVERLEAENARLRKALTYLTKDPSMFCCDCPDIREFCRDALEGKD